jgi:hypothetical protein
MSRTQVLSVAFLAGVAVVYFVAGSAAQSAQHYPLESAEGLRLFNIAASAAVHEGRRSVRVTMSDAARGDLSGMTPAERAAFIASGATNDYLAVIPGSTFANGTIEAEIAGAPQSGAAEGARGFVGIAFRVQGDLRTYDAFYLRPTNGRADDQVRRNHSTQYISHPAWTWSRLRSEEPKKYESYVDLVPGAWTKVRIEVDGVRARLFVHDQSQPVLIVNDLKTGPDAHGAVALWIDVGTEAHFRNVSVRPRPARR